MRTIKDNHNAKRRCLKRQVLLTTLLISLIAFTISTNFQFSIRQVIIFTHKEEYDYEGEDNDDDSHHKNDNRQQQQELMNLQHHSTTTATTTTPRFLIYYTHSGFSNQLLSLERAAKFAFATNRTLVLPPILPHMRSPTWKDDTKFLSYGPRAIGNKCHHISSAYENMVNLYIPQDIENAKDKEIAFPSFKEIFDFDDLTLNTGVHFVDMREFVTLYTTNYSNGTTSSSIPHDDKKWWCTGPIEEMKIKFVRNCAPDSTFDELVPFYNKHCGHDDNIVAVLGSAFVIPQRYKADSMYFNKELQTLFSNSFGNMKLSKKFMALLKVIYKQLSYSNQDADDDHTTTTTYSAVHIRFEDDLEITNCNATAIRNVYLDVLARLEERNVTNGSHIFVADSNPSAFRCFQYHSKSADHSRQRRYRPFCIQQFLSSNNNNNNNNKKKNQQQQQQQQHIQEMFENINVQKDTLYLLLDQIMAGLGKEVVFSYFGKMSGSTFQGQINRWHENRESILAALE